MKLLVEHSVVRAFLEWSPLDDYRICILMHIDTDGRLPGLSIGLYVSETGVIQAIDRVAR